MLNIFQAQEPGRIRDPGFRAEMSQGIAQHSDHKLVFLAVLLAGQERIAQVEILSLSYAARGRACESHRMQLTILRVGQAFGRCTDKSALTALERKNIGRRIILAQTLERRYEAEWWLVCVN